LALAHLTRARHCFSKLPVHWAYVGDSGVSVGTLGGATVGSLGGSVIRTLGGDTAGGTVAGTGTGAVGLRGGGLVAWAKMSAS
jgi:hypothetical protein